MVHVGLPRKVETLKQCNSTLFSQLYEALTGSRVPGLSLQAPTSEAVKCQAVVDALNVHLFPHVTLDHIRGENVAKLDILSVKNLLDVFSVLFHVPLVEDSSGSECGQGGGGYVERHEDSGATTESENELDDSNIISSAGMSVISEVLREELGHSSRSQVTDSTTELVKPVPVATLPTGTFKPTERRMRGQNDESSYSANSHPPSLTISTLHSTSTEGSSCHHGVASETRDTMPAGRERADIDSRRVNSKGVTSIPSGESSIGTTPSPKLHTPPQSPRQQQTLSPLHHSTPHTSTRSRLFPFSSSTSTAISSSSSSHPLYVAAVTPSVTTQQQRSRPPPVDKMADDVTKKKYQPCSDKQHQDTPSNLTTEESTLLPESSPSPDRSRHTVQDLTIIDLHTTLSSGREASAVEQVEAGDSYTDLSDSTCTTSSETPPPSRGRTSRNRACQHTHTSHYF